MNPLRHFIKRDKYSKNMGYEIVKRTFEAKNYPKGSEERDRLNKDAKTSEYGSDKYILFKDGKRSDTFQTLKAAQRAAEIDEEYNK